MKRFVPFSYVNVCRRSAVLSKARQLRRRPRPARRSTCHGTWSRHNDPVNLMSYVTMVFQRVFGYPREKAELHMLEVHRNGRSILWSGCANAPNFLCSSYMAISCSRRSSGRNKMEVFRRNGSLEITEIDPFLAELLRQIPTSTNPESIPAAEERLLQSARRSRRKGIPRRVEIIRRAGVAPHFSKRDRGSDGRSAPARTGRKAIRECFTPDPARACGRLAEHAQPGASGDRREIRFHRGGVVRPLSLADWITPRSQSFSR